MVCPVPGVTTMPTWQGKFSCCEPTAAGSEAMALLAAAAPVVRQSLTVPGAEPATTTVTVSTWPGAALTTVAEVMLSAVFCPVILGEVATYTGMALAGLV